MARAPAGAVIHLGAGTFETRGVKLKEGWRLLGAGKDRTKIRLEKDALTVAGTSAAVVANFDAAGFFDHVEVADLTIDCNREEQPVFVRGEKGDLTALTTACRNARIRRVRVLGTWSNPGEGFPLSVISAGSSDGSNRVEIDECESISPRGSQTAISAFDQSGSGRLSGFIRNCRVVDGPEAVGFGAGGWKNFRVSGNTTIGLAAGIVIDTHDYENVLIENNRFYETRRWGLMCNGSGIYRGLVIRGNRFEMLPTAEWCLATSKAKAEVQIEGNTFIQGSTYRPVFWIGRHTRGVIRGNVIDGLRLNESTLPVALRFVDNVDLRQRPVRARRKK